MQKINHSELAKRLILRAIENYRNKFILEEDLMSGEDKRKVLEEIDKEVEEIKHKKSYKKEITEKVIEPIENKMKEVIYG
jgi:hypothetical protein